MQTVNSYQRRVVGAMYDLAEPGDHFAYLSRGEQAALDVQRHRPSAWLALDDDQAGWSKWAKKHFVFTDRVRRHFTTAGAAASASKA